MKPWHVEIFGAPIELGDFATVIATADHKIRLSIWPAREGNGGIRIGNCCLLCPGLRVHSAASVIIEDNCMLASNVYVTDADWHGIYDRVSIGSTAAVKIQANAWVGDSAIVCKGVTIGANSIVGAGAVVVSDVPDNVIVAGNPARIVKELDPKANFVTRSQWYANPRKLSDDFDLMDRRMLGRNTMQHWLRHVFFPTKNG